MPTRTGKISTVPRRELHGFVAYDNRAIVASDGSRLSATINPLYGRGKTSATVVGYEYAVEHGGVNYRGQVKDANPAREPITLYSSPAGTRRTAKPRFRFHGATAEQVAFSVGGLYVQAFRDGQIYVKKGFTEMPATPEITALAKKLMTEHSRN